MRILFLILVCAYAVAGCKENTKIPKEVIKIEKPWLDSIIKKSDTSWVKPYRNNYFVSAVYYVDKKDSIVSQLMKDSAGTIRQVSIAKYDKIRLHFSEYYANGQLMAKLPLDSNGKFHGPSKLFYPTGAIKSMGQYEHGFYSGQWENFDEKGKLLFIEVYDTNGQLSKTIK
jgi:antitoxin component YwqK of YwqJK toxin-antitoxin module